MPGREVEVSAICWYWICRCLSWDWKYLQFAGFGFADTYRGEFRMWKYLQLAGIGLVDTYRGEFRTWKYLQFAGYEFADAWSGLEASAIC